MRRQSPLQRLQNLLHSHPSISPLLVLLISCIVFTLLNPRFAQPGTIGIILQQTAVIAALAIGQTLVILTAGIDLSVGAIAILSTLFSANLAVKNGVPGIIGECGGNASCGTCHVFVREEFMALVGEPNELEEDLLEMGVDDRRETSRLSCQITVAPELDGLTVDVAPRDV
jgi:ferredoxin